MSYSAAVAAIHYACSLTDGDGQNEARPCMDMFKAIHDLMWAGEFAALDAILGVVEVTTMRSLMICALPRYCFVARKSLPAWQPFVVRGHAELVRRGENADDILPGGGTMAIDPTNAAGEHANLWGLFRLR
jgi:hypothetical protein